MWRSTWPEPLATTGVGAREVSRFAVTGGAAYLVDVVAFNLALWGGMEHLSAKVLSSTAAVTVAYLGSRYYTWPTAEPRTAHPVLAFVAISAVAAAVQLACLWVSHDLIGWTRPLADNLSANVVGMGLATAVRFWAFRRLVFGSSPGQVIVAPAAHPVHRAPRLLGTRAR